jgi:hypothetical protein
MNTKKCSKSNPFILQLEAAVIADGYSTVKNFVRFHIREGKDFRDIHQIIKEKYGIIVHYLTIIRNLRGLAPDNYVKGTLNYPKWRRIARKQGYKSIREMLQDCVNISIPKPMIASKLKISVSTLDRLFKVYEITMYEEVNKDNPDFKYLNIKVISTYFKWLKHARKLGYASIWEAIEDLIEQGYSWRQMAWKLDIPFQTLWSKCKIARQIIEKEQKHGKT